MSHSMNSNIKYPSVSKAKFLVNKITESLSNSTEDEKSMERALSWKRDLEDLTNSVTKLRNLTFFDTGTNEINTNILTECYDVCMLNKSVEVAIDAVKNKNYKVFMVIKKLLYSLTTEKIQGKSSAFGESDDTISNLIGDSQEGEEGEERENKDASVLYYLLMITEDVNYASQLLDENEELLTPVVEFDTKYNPFFWITCKVFYRQHEVLLREDITFSKLISYSSETRDRIFNILLICEWMLANRSKIDESKTGVILSKIKKFVSKKDAIIKLQSLCKPYLQKVVV